MNNLYARGRFLGMKSCFRLGLAPLGATGAKFHRQLNTPERLSEGLVIILPGIEGPSAINDEIARGLAVSGTPYAIQIVDWRISKGWNPLHLTKLKYNQKQALRVAGIIEDYQATYARPVHLIGHSGGGGMAMFILENLSNSALIDSVILLAAAISPNYPKPEVLAKSKTGVWNFCSYADWLALGLGTLLFGTIDRRFGWAAGAVGLHVADDKSFIDRPTIKNVFFNWKMIKQWNFGGHFGPTNAAFIAEFITPIVVQKTLRSSERQIKLRHHKEQQPHLSGNSI